MTRLTTRGPATAQAIANREPFTTSGALRATAGYDYSVGQLPRSCEDRLRDADYVVYSYATPIAWHVDGYGWIIPAIRYSITTTKHQGNLYLIPADDIVSRPNPTPDRYGMTAQPSSTGGVWAG